MVKLSEQRSIFLRRLFKFAGNLIPNPFTFKIAALSKLFRAVFYFLISVKSIVSAAEFCVHYNGIFTRNPHNHPLSSDGTTPCHQMATV